MFSLKSDFFVPAGLAGGAVIYSCTEDGAIIWAIGCASEE